MKTKRRKFSSAFKAEVAIEALKERIPPTNHVLHSHLAVLCFVGKGS
jgi:hypothetical protein